MSETSVGIIGLGNMGSAMARTCQRAGLTVFATDVTAAARERAAASGITVVETIAALVDQTQCIMLSLPSSREVSAVVEGPGGVLECAPSGTLIIDTTTADPSETRRIAQLLRVAGHDMVDAPLSGGPAGAEAGTLTIVIGGTADAQARAAQVLNAIGETLVPVGDVGAGHVAKLMNNLLVAAHLGLMREAIGAGVAAGLDAQALLNGINAGTGRNLVSEVMMEKWVLNGAFDSGFATALMRKDVRLARELAAAVGTDGPLVSAVAELWGAGSPWLDDADDFTRMAAPVTPTSE